MAKPERLRNLRRRTAVSRERFEQMQAVRRDFRAVIAGPPTPPSPIVKEMWTNGTISSASPLGAKLLLMAARCLCGHISEAHRMRGMGACDAHRCPCEGYLQDPVYALGENPRIAEDLMITASGGR